MKNLFIISLVCLSSIIFAQEVTGQKETTNELNNNSTNFSNQEVEEEKELEEIQTEAPSAPVQPASRSKKTKSIQPETIQSNVSRSQELTISYTQFENTEKASNRNSFQRNPTREQQVKMESEVARMGFINKNSFMYNLSYYKSGNYDVNRIEYLKNAEVLEPNNKDVITEFVAYYTIKKDRENLNKYLKRMAYPAELYAYAEDVLKSVPDTKVFLLTHGNMDTHPLQMKASELGKSNFEIINIDYLQSELYKDNLKEMGLSFPNSKVVDKDFVKDFCKMNGSKNIHIAMTLPKDYLEVISSNLYVQGLTFKYSETKLETFYSNKANWENKLKKDLFEKDFTSDLSNQLKANYLPLLIEIQRGYELLGNKTEALKYKAIANQISASINKSKELKKALKN